MIFCKYKEFFKISVSLLFMSMLALANLGCGDSASSQLNGSLKTMNNKLKSYTFAGSATIDMGDIQGSGSINYEGFFQAPSQVYMKMDMGIMDQSQQLELFIDTKGKIYSKAAGTEWLPYLAPPNLSNFQQPGQNQNGVQILHTLINVVEKINGEGTATLDDKEVTLVSATANTGKLKSFISRRLTDNSRASDDEKDLVKKLVNDMDIEQQYKVYIDPKTGYILKLTLHQKTILRIQEQESLITTSMDYNYSNFNEPVTLPEIPGVTDL